MNKYEFKTHKNNIKIEIKAKTDEEAQSIIEETFNTPRYSDLVYLDEVKMEIEVIEKDLTDYRKAYYVELEINNKTIEISIQEDYNYNGDYSSVDWDLITDIELEDEEYDLIDDWVKTYQYEKVKK